MFPSYNQCLFFVPYKLVCKLNSSYGEKRFLKLFIYGYVFICYISLLILFKDTLDTVKLIYHMEYEKRMKITNFLDIISVMKNFSKYYMLVPYQ